MTTADIEKDLREKVSESVSLHQEGVDRFRVLSPFVLDDGDHVYPFTAARWPRVWHGRAMLRLLAYRNLMTKSRLRRSQIGDMGLLASIAWHMRIFPCKLFQAPWARRKNMDATSAGLSAAALKKAAILSAIAQYPDGAYGLKRLQKVVYRASQDSEVKPFSYCLWNFGQHSRELTTLLNEMIDDGLIDTERLRRGTGNAYRLSLSGRALIGCIAPVEQVLPGYMKGLAVAMRDVGLATDEKINVWAKSRPELEGKLHGDDLLEENVPQLSEISELTELQIGDLEMAINTGLLGGVTKVVDCLKSSSVDFSVLHQWDGKESISASGS